ncbi:hypothetical protein GALMADRAFT_161887 [Galerina marginata CBS 339.88]|uniref:Uncharacterized protein n=1 Tax=Galerina marginata (strain CBS 339.88) TaxID=685588 RepID=A0A067SAK2_GALM3|nr:hypothetical protein GALMADRAFT_161887 [Galerina marginata CBS 339.88]
MNTVLVDDSDPSIQYGPGWVKKPPSLLAQSNPNYPMYGTLHEAINQTDLTYSFSGSSITACAQITGITFPSLNELEGASLWNCSVDGVQIHILPGLCCASGTDELSTQVQHEIHISAIGSQDHSISFDYLTYETSLPVPVADLLMLPGVFLNAGPGGNVDYRNIEGWGFEPTGLASTTEPTGNFSFDFYGSSILWFSFYNTTFVGLNDTEVKYSVDGSPAASDFGIFLEPSNAKQVLNASETDVVEFLIFQTFALPRGQHTLEVFYSSGGLGKAIPITLTKLVVQNGTITPNSSVPTTTPTPAGANGVRRVHLAIILGCCGAAILALIIFGIFCARRRMKRRGRASPESGTSSLIEPFNHDPASAPVGTHQKGQRPSEVQEQVVVDTVEVQVEAPPSYVTGPHDS